MVNRNDLLIKFGGDSIRTLKTKKYLERQGVEVKLLLNEKESVDIYKYDVIHIFNIQNLRLISKWNRVAKKRPVVISTIWWRSNKTLEFLYRLYRQYNPKYKVIINLFEKIVGETMGIRIFSQIHRYKFAHQEREFLKRSRWIITESESEAKQLENFLHLNIVNKTTAIPSGLNREIFITEPDKKKGLGRLPNNFVLSVGRIDPVKNQVGIITAMLRDNSIPLVFVGSKTGPLSYKKYIEEFEILSKKHGNVYWFDNQNQQDLRSFYEKASVYCQPSAWETFGMAACEAVYAGCNLVITEEGGIKDYFKNAVVCDPYNIESIRTAILKAVKQERGTTRAYDWNVFEWDDVAKKTFECYSKALGFNK